MLRKRLLKVVYNVYNIINSNSINKLYLECKKKWDSNPDQRIELIKYLKKWNFDTEITKNKIQTKLDLNKYIDLLDDKNIYSWAYTGGSYGEPFRMPYSKKRDHIRTATFKYANEKAGYILGDPYLVIRAKNKSEFFKFLRNETVFIPFDVTQDQIAKLLNTIKFKKIELIFGYPSVIFELAIYLNKNLKFRQDLNIKSIVSISEPIENYKKKFIYEMFKCKVIDRYSSEEVGLIAQQKDYKSPYYVNNFGIYTEVVDPHTFLSVETGERGKVLVTDFYNDLVPVVRYDTGDFATANEYRNGHLYSITNILGRVTEQIKSVSGKIISPLVLGPYIYKPLSKSGNLFQYQFAQTSVKNYELRIKKNETVIKTAILNGIKEDLLNILGAKAQLKIIYVDDIKPKPSGKRPIYVNEL